MISTSPAWWTISAP